MKIKNFRVKNYKSIVDSGDCSLESDLTVFAGKNESGKSSLLEALADFNIDAEINENTKPKSNESLEPEIKICFTITDSELNDYYNRIGAGKKMHVSKEITITKYFPNIYGADDSTIELMHLDNKNYPSIKEGIKAKLEELTHKLANTNAVYLPNFSSKFPNVDYENLMETIEQFDLYEEKFKSVYYTYINDDNIKSSYLEALEEIGQNLKELDELGDGRNPNWDLVFLLIPNFILFKSFEDNIPSEVSFEDLSSSSFIKDLELISDFNSVLVKSDTAAKKFKHKDLINLSFNKDYSTYWTQDNTTLKVEWDSKNLYVYIVEDDELFEPTQRSKGKQWHLSFYLKVSARSKEDNVNILLLDEPGLFLHASAQKDIYQRLITSSKDSQTIFTTHSPYLINPDELYRVRLIEKQSTTVGTTVTNKIHAKADKETLTPILTAIGVELNEGISNVGYVNNVVVEGPSDVFYLNAFKKFFNSKLNFVFGGGAGNMGNVGTILQGWGCKVIYVYDNDKGKSDGQKALTKTWLIKKDFISSISENAGSIEDMFDKEDFKKLVLTDEAVVIPQTISEYLKVDKKFNKVLISRNFVSKFEDTKGQLSDDTIARFKAVFVSLEKLFDTYDVINEK